MITGLPNKLFTRERLRKWGLPLSILLFVISLLFSCVVVRDDDGIPGFMVLVLGGMSISASGAVWAWFANPFILIAWLTFRRLPDISFFFSTAAFIAAASCLFYNYTPDNYSTLFEMISNYSWGYWLWLMSCSIMFAGNIMVITQRKKQKRTILK